MLERGDLYRFNSNDYDTFRKENWFRDDKEINKLRNGVQTKFKDIHSELSKRLLENKIDLHEHYREQNITSLPFVNITTPRETGINWLSLRYGISVKKAKELGFDIAGKDKISSYLNHQCIQINIAEDGFYIGLYHGTKQGTFDNSYTKKQISTNKSFCNELIEELENLRGYGFKWSIGSNCFYLDSADNMFDFINFYEKNDNVGLYSNCTIFIPKWDIRLKEENIVDTCYFYIEVLYKLYEITSYKKEVNK